MDYLEVVGITATAASITALWPLVRSMWNTWDQIMDGIESKPTAGTNRAISRTKFRYFLILLYVALCGVSFFGIELSRSTTPRETTAQIILMLVWIGMIIMHVYRLATRYDFKVTEPYSENSAVAGHKPKSKVDFPSVVWSSGEMYTPVGAKQPRRVSNQAYSREWLIEIIAHYGASMEVPFMVFHGYIHDTSDNPRSILELFEWDRPPGFWEDLVTDVLADPPSFYLDDLMYAEDPTCLVAYSMLAAIALRYPELKQRIDSEAAKSGSLQILMIYGYRKHGEPHPKCISDYRADYKVLAPEALYLLLSETYKDQEYVKMLAEEFVNDSTMLEIVDHFTYSTQAI